MLSEPLTRYHTYGTQLSIPEAEETVSALSAFRHGDSVLLIDQIGLNTVGNLVLAAEHASTEQVALLVRYGSGLICCAIPARTCQRLRIPPMWHTPPSVDGPQYLVSVDAAEQISTGISAADRAHTLRTLGGREGAPDHLIRPGHVMVAQARMDDPVTSWGYCEKAVSLAVQAGRTPAAALCAVVSETDRTLLAGRDELKSFADRRGIAVVESDHLVPDVPRTAVGTSDPAF